MSFEAEVDRMRDLLREMQSAPLPASHPTLVVQDDGEGRFFAGLCSHLTYGDSPEDAVQALIVHLEGLRDGGKEEKSSSLEGGAESARPIKP